MYEKKKQRPLSRARFIRRFVAHLSIAIALLAISLAIGMSGYEYFEDLPWRNAFLNSAMLLGGMGPVDPVKTDGGKLFAGIYALRGPRLYRDRGPGVHAHPASRPAQVSLGRQSLTTHDYTGFVNHLNPNDPELIVGHHSTALLLLTSAKARPRPDVRREPGGK